MTPTDDAIRRGLAFLAGRQLPSGQFPVQATSHWKPGSPVVDDGVTGWTVPPGDVATLADRLGTALGSDRSLVRSLGEAGHAMARERFGLDGFADRFEAVYRSIVAAPRRGASS